MNPEMPGAGHPFNNELLDSQEKIAEPILEDLFSRIARGETPYTKIISRLPNHSVNEGYGLFTPYGDLTEDIFRDAEDENDVAVEIVNYIKEKLKGGTLIDIGGSDDMRVLRLGMRVGAAATLSVDRYLSEREVDPQTGAINSENSRQLNPDPFTNVRDRVLPFWRKEWIEDREEATRRAARSYGIEQLPEFALVCDDMLDFVSRLPADSSNFMINGIDDLVLQDPTDEYQNALAQEIVRSLKPGGIIFGTNLDNSMSSRLEKLGLERKFTDESNKDSRYRPLTNQGTFFLEKPVVAD